MLSLTHLTILALSLLSGFTTIIGVVIAISFRNSIKGIVIGIGFSSGIMLLISFIELIPESVSLTGTLNTFIATFIGILMFGVLNLILPHTHLVKEKREQEKNLLKTAYLIAFGLILHDLPEGFAMANSYLVSPALGNLMALAIAIHNIPEEFAMALPIVSIETKIFLFKVALISALAEPAGAIAGLAATHFIPTLTPIFMSIAAGAMIFISIHELIPMAKGYQNMALFIYGIVLSVIVYLGLTLFII